MDSTFVVSIDLHSTCTHPLARCVCAPGSIHFTAEIVCRATTPRPSPRPSLKTPPRSLSLTRRVSLLSGSLGHADPARLPSSPYSSANPAGFVSGRKPLGLRPDPPCLPFRPLSHLTSLPSARRASARHKLFILDILAHKPIAAGLGDCTKPFARNLLQLSPVLRAMQDCNARLIASHE